ncbi:MAG TPA: tRNA (adenosine(37)-N6)-dimethylallyltransferase MiaA [Angustibacter sp.]|nr:tRNA (adenosine(37)-N6)-dimethylallyltransferase MiaA [Angustibacter sp.]
MLVIAVVGPTATGKSDLGVALARALGGDVVNADAMQLYRGMDIGTAKLTVAERHGVPHHLLDVLDVSEEASVAAYQRAVGACVDDLVAHGRVPVLVGGSGLYVRAALDDLQIPPTDREVRARLERLADELGAPALHARLAAVDPVAAERILPSNARRVVRALEVVELTGRPFSASLPEPRYLRPTVQIGLRAPRPELDDRIVRRVERMWRGGLLDEVERLVPRGLREGRTASRAVGYAQALAQLDGLLDAEQARQQTAQLTRRLARRQESWFGRDDRITWLESAAPDLLEQALAVVRSHTTAGDDR